jgi:hypothetical protein
MGGLVLKTVPPALTEMGVGRGKVMLYSPLLKGSLAYTPRPLSGLL